MSTLDFLSKLRLDLAKDIAAAQNMAELANAKARAFGKEGILTLQMRALQNLSGPDRSSTGRLLNDVKREIQVCLTQREEELAAAELQKLLNQETVDVTLPSRGVKPGGLHPITQVSDRIESIFLSMGFDVTDGPEIEEDFFNFTALNTPEGHPARSMHDTFYVDVPGREDLLLRTHTSPIQVRYARAVSPPIKTISIGKTYRVDSDATHSPMFHQLEGLWVGDDLNFSNLKSIYSDFLKIFFERKDLKVRFRPSYFPFTEPSCEIDIYFPSGSISNQWLEISGAGQVHPNVVRSFGLDPEIHIGFAFGSGIERLAMLLYGIHDLRLFYGNDLRFLRQFC